MMRPELRDIRLRGRLAAPVCAIVFGAFAVHETVNPSDDDPDYRWVVTRVQCGRKFPRRFTKDDAVSLAVEANAAVGRMAFQKAEPILLDLWKTYMARGVFGGDDCEVAPRRGGVAG